MLSDLRPSELGQVGGGTPLTFGASRFQSDTGAAIVVATTTAAMKTWSIMARTAARPDDDEVVLDTVMDAQCEMRDDVRWLMRACVAEMEAAYAYTRVRVAAKAARSSAKGAGPFWKVRGPHVEIVCMRGIRHAASYF